MKNNNKDLTIMLHDHVNKEHANLQISTLNPMGRKRKRPFNNDLQNKKPIKIMKLNDDDDGEEEDLRYKEWYGINNELHETPVYLNENVESLMGTAVHHLHKFEFRDCAKVLYQVIYKKRDHVQARSLLGRILYSQLQDYESGFKYLDSVKDSCSYAANGAALCYRIGKGTKKDRQKAMEIYENCYIHQKNGPALISLAYMYGYELGENNPREEPTEERLGHYQEMIKLYHYGMEVLNYAPCYFNCGVAYITFFPNDIRKRELAREYFKKAATEFDDCRGYFNLAYVLLNPIEGEEQHEFTEVLKYLKLAKENGHKKAAENISVIEFNIINTYSMHTHL